MQQWSNSLQTERIIPWRRSRVIVVGEGRSGKTSFIRALQNLPFKNTASTDGVDTATMEATDMFNWSKLDGNEFEQVRPCK